MIYVRDFIWFVVMLKYVIKNYFGNVVRIRVIVYIGIVIKIRWVMVCVVFVSVVFVISFDCLVNLRS